MTRLRPQMAVVTIAVLAILLAGCSVSATPTSATPRPIPSPTTTPAPKPGWPFAIGCAGILSLDEVRAVTTATATVMADTSTTVAYGAAAHQGGALLCDWGSPQTEDSSVPIPSLSVHVLPDATTAEQKFISYGPAGVDPSRTCGSGACWQASMVAGNDVEIQWSAPAHAHDADGGLAAFQPLVATITSRLADPGEPAPAWTVPDGPSATTYCEGGGGKDQFIPAVAGALGLDPADVVAGGGTGGDTGVLGASVGRTDYGACGWGPQGDGEWVFLTILRGGSWALDALRSGAVGATDAGDPAHPGAFIVDHAHGDEFLTLSSKGSLVEINLEPSGGDPISHTDAARIMIEVTKALGL